MGWDEDGNECEVLSTFDGGVVVQYAMESDGEPRWSQPHIVKSVFDEPPAIRKAKQIADYDEQLAEKRKELSLLTRQIREAKAGNDALLAKLSSSNAALQHVADYIDGKITHYVTETNCEYRILTFAEAVSECETGYKRKPRLLSLFGDSEGNLQWRLNVWHDPSGSSVRCRPCMSEEHARETAKSLVLKDFTKDLGRYQIDLLIQSAERFGVAVPQELTLSRLERKSAELTQEANAANAKLDVIAAERLAIEIQISEVKARLSLDSANQAS